MCDNDFPLNPMIYEDMRSKMSHPRKDTLLADMRANGGLSGRRNVPFMLSRRWCASYDAMIREQREFYMLWRSEVLEGRYRDSDRRYLWLLLCETIESDRDPERRMTILNGLLKAYGQSSENISNLILRTCQDYVLLTDQDPFWEKKGDNVEAPDDPLGEVEPRSSQSGAVGPGQVVHGPIVVQIHDHGRGLRDRIQRRAESAGRQDVRGHRHESVELPQRLE